MEQSSSVKSQVFARTAFPGATMGPPEAGCVRGGWANILTYARATPCGQTRGLGRMGSCAWDVEAHQQTFRAKLSRSMGLTRFVPDGPHGGNVPAPRASLRPDFRLYNVRWRL